MKGFPGFPDGKLKLTQIHNLFFSDLLPIIDDLGELKVTLYAFWALQYREGNVRYLRLTDFLNDSELMKGLVPTATIAANNLVDALERAVARGTFLHISVGSADGNMDLYFLNTEKGRSAIEGITRGEWRPSADDSEPITLLVERPNIFVLYEQNIGTIVLGGPLSNGGRMRLALRHGHAGHRASIEAGKGQQMAAVVHDGDAHRPLIFLRMGFCSRKLHLVTIVEGEDGFGSHGSAINPDAGIIRSLIDSPGFHA